MHKQLIWIIGLLLSIAAIALYFVWVPDIWSKAEHIVAKQKTSEGYQFTVTQIWNHTDFYSTYLRCTEPGGQELVYLLDGDDIKRWSCKFLADESAGNIQVILGGQQSGTFDWKRKIFKNKRDTISEPVE